MPQLTIASPVGALTLTEERNRLVRIEFADAGAADRTPLLESAARQLTEYFAGTRRDFDIPLAPAGTLFQQEVWRALRDIPYGTTRSYKSVAEAVGRPQACRAVGMANNRNPLPIVVPCHRVVGASGALVGYAGGLDVKRALLDLERSAVAEGLFA
ncbi:MAG: methylated-DNA--[protein]-cysteine S-methyltransferase [Alistipes sp.]|nr:methylated-DNA--[protein]-cysteine S-methyltransferase [Alistipes sp.]